MSSLLSAPHFHDEEAAVAYVEARVWANGVSCPHCGNADDKRIGKLTGKSTRIGVRKCYVCRKPFTVKVGTIFESSHVPLHLWLQAIHLMCASKKGISSNQLHRVLGITLKSAWFLSHRIRAAMKPLKPTPMGGEGKGVEVDETFIGPAGYQFESGKGWRVKPGTGDRHIIVSLVERGSRARSIKAGSLKGHEVKAIVMKNADRRSKLATDEARIYGDVGIEFAEDMTVHHRDGEYVRGEASTNVAEGSFSIFKRGMRGIYQHCGENHLERYLAEFDFRYSNRVSLGYDDTARADEALQGVSGKRLTYRTTH